MDPAAFNPPKELREDIVYSVDKLINVWLEHEGREFRQAIANRLQRLVSGLPWLLSSLHPLAQSFILNELRLHPPAATTHPATHASLPGPTKDVLPSPSTQPSRGKRRSRVRCSSPQSDLGISERPAVVSGQDNNIGLDCETFSSGVVRGVSVGANSHSLPTYVVTDLSQVGILKTSVKAMGCCSSVASEPVKPMSAKPESAKAVAYPPDTINTSSNNTQTVYSFKLQPQAELAISSVQPPVQQPLALHPVSVSPPVQLCKSCQPERNCSSPIHSKQRDKPNNNVNIPQELASSETEIHSRASPVWAQNVVINILYL
ncbi:unnamed protein product [Oreochromis niloticus]|nr:unnamed protein product [Mustela putorius furo]